MKAIACIALTLGLSTFPVQSGEIIKRDVQYGKSDTISSQYVFQSDRKKSKTRKRSSSLRYRPVRSYDYAYVPLRSNCYRPQPRTCRRPVTARPGCTIVRITYGR